MKRVLWRHSDGFGALHCFRMGHMVFLFDKLSLVWSGMSPLANQFPSNSLITIPIEFSFFVLTHIFFSFPIFFLLFFDFFVQTLIVFLLSLQ